MKTDLKLTSLILVSILFSLLVPSTGRADYFINGEGRKHPFCEKILATLNRSNPTLDTLPCVSEEVLKIPGVGDPPGWEKIDLAQHVELAKKIDILNQVGSIEYFDRRAPDQWPKPEDEARWIEYVKQRKGEFYVLRLPIYGNQMMIGTVRYQNRCGSPLQDRGEAASSGLITLDLNELSERQHYLQRPGRPLLYRGRLYLANLNPDTGVEMSIPTTYGAKRICNISFSDGTDANGKPKWGQAK